MTWYSRTIYPTSIQNVWIIIYSRSFIGTILSILMCILFFILYIYIFTYMYSIYPVNMSGIFCWFQFLATSGEACLPVPNLSPTCCVRMDASFLGVDILDHQPSGKGGKKTPASLGNYRGHDELPTQTIHYSGKWDPQIDHIFAWSLIPKKIGNLMTPELRYPSQQAFLSRCVSLFFQVMYLTSQEGKYCYALFCTYIKHYIPTS